MMKSENGLDSAMRRRFSELTAALRLDGLNIQMDGTPKTVQRGDMLELRVQGRYKINSLKPFGKELSVPLSMRLHGLAHTYVRGK
jgi:hypothetical protein